MRERGNKRNRDTNKDSGKKIIGNGEVFRKREKVMRNRQRESYERERELHEIESYKIKRKK
jgi:hypothetical protein